MWKVYKRFDFLKQYATNREICCNVIPSFAECDPPFPHQTSNCLSVVECRWDGTTTNLPSVPMAVIMLVVICCVRAVPATRCCCGINPCPSRGVWGGRRWKVSPGETEQSAMRRAAKRCNGPNPFCAGTVHLPNRCPPVRPRVWAESCSPNPRSPGLPAGAVLQGHRAQHGARPKPRVARPTAAVPSPEP